VDQRTAPDDLDGSDKDASGKPIHVYAMHLTKLGFAFGTEPLQAGIDVDPLSDVRGSRPEIDRLATSHDQFGVGLADAEGSHGGAWFRDLAGQGAE
jgi:hypothetical protein